MAIGVKDGRWKVGSTAIYTPAIDTQIEHTNVVSDDSGRRQNGVMKIVWVRRDIVKIHLHWNSLTGNMVKELESLMQGKEFEFTYWDNGSHTISAYCGESDYKIHTYALYKDQGGLYQDFTINVIEM